MEECPTCGSCDPNPPHAIDRTFYGIELRMSACVDEFHRAAGPSPDPKPPSRTFCCSFYSEELAEMDRMVAELKSRGIASASRDSIIRMAVSLMGADMAEALL